METLNVAKPSQNASYDPAAATAFFESAGVVEKFEADKNFFVEQQKRGFFTADDRMFLLVEGSVALSVGGKSLDTIKAGEIFGEMATITNSPRSATATAKTACRVISLNGSQFQKAIQKTPRFALMLMGIMIDRLRLTLARLVMTNALPDGDSSDMRRVFDDKTLDEIERHLGYPALVRFMPKHKIIQAGEVGVLMYLPREGRVAIQSDGHTLEHVGVGGVFGEMALVDRSVRVCDAVAETECALLAVNRDQFLTLVKAKPDFGLSLLKVLGLRLKAATRQRSK